MAVVLYPTYSLDFLFPTVKLKLERCFGDSAKFTAYP
jgi:hypothetical protein